MHVTKEEEETKKQRKEKKETKETKCETELTASVLREGQNTRMLSTTKRKKERTEERKKETNKQTNKERKKEKANFQGSLWVFFFSRHKHYFTKTVKEIRGLIFMLVELNPTSQNVRMVPHSNCM